MNTILLLALGALLAAATISDCRTRRIPNKLILAGIASGFILQAAAFISGSLLNTTLIAAVLGCLTGLGLFLPFWLLRTLGAGDVKLLAMVGVFLGPQHTAYTALWTMLAGGVLSLTWALCSGVLRQVISNIHAMCVTTLINIQTGGGIKVEAPAKTGRLPYAIAIAVGTLIEVTRTLTS